MKRKVALIVSWAPILLYSGLIFFLSSLSHPPIPGGIPNLDKILHLVEYSVWGFLFSMALRTTWPGLSFRTGIVLASLGGILYGLSDEFHQMFVSGRMADLADNVFDGIGAFLGAFLQGFLNYRKRKSGEENTRLSGR